MSCDNLYTPTWITKIDEKYYIVDCWHHRIICSEELYKPIKDWEKYDDVLGGHTITTDGEGMKAYDDTDNDVVVFRNGNDEIKKRITLSEYLEDDLKGGNQNGLVRPHFVLYDGKKREYIIALSWGVDS